MEVVLGCKNNVRVDALPSQCFILLGTVQQLSGGGDEKLEGGALLKIAAKIGGGLK